MKRRVIQITFTEQCNLHCVYCYEHKKDLQVLPLQSAKDFIEAETQNLDDYDEFELGFHGGEPMLAFDRIKTLAEWVWSLRWPKPYILFATTNGTLVHGEVKEWFKKNAKRFVLGLSLDGTKAQHDVNRSSSYDKIDFAFFREMWPMQGVKATVSPISIGDLYSGVRNILALGFKYSVNLAYGMNWSDDLLPVYRRELQKIADFYLERPDLEIPSLFSHILPRLGADSQIGKSKHNNRKWCGTGAGMICIAPNGKTYPCQSFMPSSEVEDGDSLPLKIDFSNDKAFDDPECANCLLDGACPSCYGNNYLRTGTLHSRDKSLCKFRKIEAVAASYLYGMMLLCPWKYKVINELSNHQKLAIAYGVKLVQEMLATEVDSY
jgi:radical SAM protein with 4Fe4S-binding SPASM domain